MDLAIRVWVISQMAMTSVGDRLRRDERGQGFVEYILILAFVGIIAVVLYTAGVKGNATKKVADFTRDLFNTATT
jgi:Flp pilus assembly pilin Flp